MLGTCSTQTTQLLDKQVQIKCAFVSNVISVILDAMMITTWTRRDAPHITLLYLCLYFFLQKSRKTF